jgi:DNA-binding MarR family transcriptional regulator
VIDRTTDAAGGAVVGIQPSADGQAVAHDAADREIADADTTIATLRAAVLVLSRRMRYHQASDDISTSETAVLARLGRGPTTPSQLAKAEHVRPPSMTRTIERLEERGYVRRESDPDDGRQVLVSRTDAGDEFIRRSRDLRTAWLAAHFDSLDPADQDSLRGAADALRRLSETP